ncbi:pyocin activator PrtN family protein [Marinobacterium stanieri]|uniref:pyocin activator PrtN family protein n=1 Tax=Marinobacterium stanieri TaxID=49186 RepID=UPI000255A5D7|nr:pyocin activator PrtN family protein [Marinobacterium stanieri]
MKPQQPTQTLWMLMAEFGGRPTVPLKECYHHLGYTSHDKANRAAGDLELPVACFRANNSQKSPRLVHLTDLAEYIDICNAKARAEFNKIHGRKAA